ncbi:HAMP domain-containing protein [Acidovorax sp. SUPP950]|uniref:HAMP domain-containing sensor histidine kinase n=1 Tax=Acidovorax sp. SUPP950 TaxID=511901 RepID=UPI0023D58979|nr:ATP-binding protein [Acidovorax sp. SUPP950]GKS76010.1 HAMP domain-containing protein [Acidovorax sp. SUPP950]
MSNPFSRRLYLRIWLAVVVGVAVLTLAVGWAWRIASDQNAQTPPTPPAREMVLINGRGEPVLRGLATRIPNGPAEGLEFRVEAEGGEVFSLQMAPRPKPPGPDRRGEVAFWTRPPFGFLWMLGLVGVAVAVGVFPIIRRLLQRLETLQRGVQRFGEGDLSVRVAETGHDEVADLARQFNAAAARIETLVKSHKSLLANASHELRSPLTRIRMGLELMQGSAPSPAFRDEILRNIAELDQLVDEILLASRLDAREADMGTIELVDLLGLAAEECVRVDAELEAGAASADGLEVNGVAKLLRRALRNLLENARRYSQGDITVGLQRTGTHAEVRVCDQGPGVPPAQRERIFEPFYRLPGASERAGGVGLGLALVRSIAERSGGTVRCEDRPDGESGACFVLSLPLASA